MTDTAIGALRARDICELALRKIGAFPPDDVAANPNDLDVASRALDLILKHISGKTRNLWLTRTATVPLVAATIAGDLLTMMGSSAPENGWVAATSAFVRSSAGRDRPVNILRKRDYDDIEQKDAEGTLSDIYIDRFSPRPTIYFYRVAPSGTTDVLHLTFCTWGEDIRGRPIDKQLTGARPDIDLYLVSELASRCGAGLVRALPNEERTQFREEAARDWLDVFGFVNQEHADEPDRVMFRDLG